MRLSFHRRPPASGSEEKPTDEVAVYDEAHSVDQSFCEPAVINDDHSDEEDHVMDPPSFSLDSMRRYFVTRWTTLIPSKQYIVANKALINPFPALKEIPRKQWLFILCAFMAWTWDAFDFFTVTLNVKQLQEDFHKKTKTITFGITLVLMLRSVGAIIFGVLADRYGTKWPLVANLLIMMVVQIGFSFVKTFQAFMGVRALFGIVMGGIYGSATATALNDCPVRPRGFVSGLVQQGYAFGYLLAVVFTRAIADTQQYKWRAVYWFAAGVSFLIAVFRAFLPETEEFQQKLQQRKEAKMAGIQTPGFLKKAGEALKTYWLISIYLVLLMAGFNFMSHGSQDLYPTFLDQQLNFSADRTTVTMCVANFGALAGGLTIGHLSTFIGRRLCILICCVGGGALVYPWGFVHNNGINAAVFFLQFFVQGAFGVVPAHLTELSHPEFKAVVVGLAYQLGNLASSASSTIEADIGDSFPLHAADGSLLRSSDGESIYDYGKVMSIFMGAVFGYLLLITFVGPENSHAVHAMAQHREQAKVSEFGDAGEVSEVKSKSSRKGSVEQLEYA